MQNTKENTNNDKLFTSNKLLYINLYLHNIKQDLFRRSIRIRLHSYLENYTLNTEQDILYEYIQRININ